MIYKKTICFLDKEVAEALIEIRPQVTEIGSDPSVQGIKVSTHPLKNSYFYMKLFAVIRTVGSPKTLLFDVH